MKTYINIPLSKECTKCHVEKPLEEFTRHNTSKYGRHSQCKPCLYDRIRKWQEANPDRVKIYNEKHKKSDKAKAYNRAYALRTVYGLNQEQVDQLMANQGSKCAICQAEGRLAVDHDHKTGKVRGLLCRACNTSLGMLKDDVEILQRAIDYLQSSVQRTGND